MSKWNLSVGKWIELLALVAEKVPGISNELYLYLTPCAFKE